MTLPTSVQIVPGNLLLSGNVHTNDTNDTFCIDHTNGTVGIGRSLTNLVDDSNVLQISGGVHATRYYGDGSQLTGLTDSKWLEDENDINNIYYSTGNVGIGGAASSINILKVHGTVEATSFSGIQESDVPNISASKITTGTLGIDQIPTISTNKISGDFGAGGNIGINTTNPYRALDVQAPARPSIYPFAIGGAWSNRAEYVAKTWDPGIVDSQPYPSVNFVVGGQGKSGWARVMVGAWKPNDQNHGSLYVYSAAHFIFAVDGPMGIDAITIRDQKTGMGAGDITMTASGEYNGVKITITRTTGQGAGVPPVKWNVWYEIYHEDGVWWS